MVWDQAELEGLERLDASVYEYDDGKEGIQNGEQQPCQTVECVYPEEKTK
jgi:hypothetical protein